MNKEKIEFLIEEFKKENEKNISKDSLFTKDFFNYFNEMSKLIRESETNFIMKNFVNLNKKQNKKN